MKLNAVHPTLPAADLDRAKKFYREKLGLLPSIEGSGGVFYEIGHRYSPFLDECVAGAAIAFGGEG